MGRGDIKYHAYTLRKEAPLPTLINILLEHESLPESSRIAISPNFFATSWSQIGEQSLPYRTENLQRSLTCSIATQAACSKSIHAHADLKVKLEHAIARGDYRGATKYLDSHSAKCGKTIWELHWRIAIANQLGGETARSTLSKEILSNTENSLLAYIIRIHLQIFDQNIPNNLLRTSIRSLADQLGEPGSALIKLMVLDELATNIPLDSLIDLFDLLPVIDRHILIIRTITHSIATDSKVDTAPLLRSLNRLSEYFPWLSNTAEIASPSENGLPLLLSDEIREAFDAYVTSNYALAKTRLSATQESSVPNLFHFELHVKSSIYLGQTIPEGTEPSSWLCKKLSDIFLRTDQVERAMSDLERFALAHPFTSLSPQILSVIAVYSASNEFHRAEALAALRSTQPNPRLLENSESLSRNLLFLSNLKKNNPSSCSVDFFYLLANGELSYKKSLDLGVSEIRTSFFLALYHFKRHEYSQAAASIETFLKHYRSDSKKENAPFALEEAERLRSIIYLKLGDAVLALRSSVEFAHTFPAGVKRIDIPAAFRLAKANRSVASHYIEYPIIAQLSVNDPHEVCLALKHYLKNVGVTRPSELIALHDVEHNLLTELLLRVCTPEVIDSIRGLDNREKVEEERLDILDWIGGTSQKMSIIADNERLRLIQQGQLRAALDRIDENKIVLNLSNLRDAEAQLFEEIYVTYKSHHDLADAKFQSGVTEALKRIHESKDRPLILDTRLVRDPLVNAYATAFKRIRDAFLLSPHFGLEACLSGKIRHGILVEHLLNPLRSRQLLFSRDKNTRNSEAPQANRFNLTGCDDGTAKKATIALEKLTSEVTALAKIAKDKWIQAKTEERNPDGLFDFSFSSDELKYLFSAQEDELLNKDSFIDNVFSTLTYRTTQSLDTIRHKIASELRRDLLSFFDDAIRVTQTLNNMHGLNASLVAARGDMGNACDEILRWFQSAGGVLSEDIDLDLVAGTAVGMLERLHPSIRNKGTIFVVPNQKIRGRFFDSLVHLVFFLIENGVKHCSPSCEDYRYSISIQRVDESIEICIENSTANPGQSENAASIINSRVAELRAKLDPARVIRDEGSGYAKIVAMLAYEFQQYSPKIAAISDGNRLSVKVVLALDIMLP